MAIIPIYIDADACPVKQEIYRVAERHALKGVAQMFVGARPDAKPDATFAGRALVVSKGPIACPQIFVRSSAALR